jgi:hypothetical protein
MSFLNDMFSSIMFALSDDTTNNYNSPINKTFGTILKSSNNQVKEQSKKYKFKRPDPEQRPLPKNFDGRAQWQGLLSSIKDQNKCGNCWAVSCVTALADRIALITNAKVKFNLSTMKITSCGYLYDKFVKDMGNLKAMYEKAKADPEYEKKMEEEAAKYAQCNGQSLYDAARLLYIFGTTTEQCVPEQGIDRYGKSYNLSDAVSNEDIPYCAHLIGLDMDVCTDNKTALVNIRCSDVYNLNPVEQELKHEIYRWGPIVCGFQVFPDFLYDYNGKGIYTHPQTNQQSLGGHAVKIVGWGEDTQDEQLIKYWICANSWGPRWGDSGYFKIQMFLKECELEDNIIGFMPDIPGFGSSHAEVGDLIGQSDEDTRMGVDWPSHVISSKTGLKKISETMIQEGKLKGSLKPLYPKEYIPSYETFWACDRSGNTKNNVGYFIVILLAIIIIVYILKNKKA